MQDNDNKFPIGPDAIKEQLRQVQSDKEQAISDALTDTERDLPAYGDVIKATVYPPTVNARPYEPEDLAKLINQFSDASDEAMEPRQVINLDLQNAESLRQSIILAIGAASLTFEEVHGVFNTEKALSISYQLHQEIQRQVGELTFALTDMIQVMDRDTFMAEWVKVMSGQSSVIDVNISPDPVEYPKEAGEIILLGPEVFISKDGSVISHKGENYYPHAEVQRQVNQHKASISRQASARLWDDNGARGDIDEN